VQQDLAARRDALLGLGVEPERVYVDHGLTGTNRERPELREASAACRAGARLVLTKLDRLARSLPDARAIVDEVTARQISLSVGCCPDLAFGAARRLLTLPRAGAAARRLERPQTVCGDVNRATSWTLTQRSDRNRAFEQNRISQERADLTAER